MIQIKALFSDENNFLTTEEMWLVNNHLDEIIDKIVDDMDPKVQFEMAESYLKKKVAEHEGKFCKILHFVTSHRFSTFSFAPERNCKIQRIAREVDGYVQSAILCQQGENSQASICGIYFGRGRCSSNEWEIG